MLTFATLVLGGIWQQGGLRGLRDRGPLPPGRTGAPAHDDGHARPGRVRQGPVAAPETGQDATPLVGRPLGELGRPGPDRGDRAGGRHHRRAPWPRAASPMPFPRRGSFPLALAAAVLTVAYFGLAFQFFLLRFAERGGMYFALFLFVAWLLPLVAGSIQSMASGPMALEWERRRPVLRPEPGRRDRHGRRDRRRPVGRPPSRPPRSRPPCSSPSSSTTCSSAPVGGS